MKTLKFTTILKIASILFVAITIISLYNVGIYDYSELNEIVNGTKK